MWKIAVGFIVFAALAMFVVFKGGNKIDMAGESAGHAVESASATAAAPTPAEQLHAPIDAAKDAAAKLATPTPMPADAAAPADAQKSTTGVTAVGVPK